jgi:SAM-dependent methyltransferase
MKPDNKPDNALLMGLAGSSGLHTKAKDCMARGDYAGAEVLLERALTAKETADAYHDLGVVYRALGKPETEQAFLAALECNPQYDPSLAALGQVYLSAGNPTQALECYARATSAKPDNLAYAEKFLELARFITINNHNPQLKDLIGSCLKRAELDFNGMGGAWQSVLVNDPAFAKIYKTAGKDDKVFDKLGDYGALTDLYFLNGLRRVVVFDRGFEKFLTFLRRRLLENLNAGSKRFLKDRYKDVAAAIAQYCFTTEYVFDITPEEQKRVDELRASVDKLDVDSVATLSCYLPPYEIPSAHAKSLFPELIASWNEQLEIRKSIPSLTKIEDDVSGKVRDQYEQFPYPRWQGFARLIKDEEAEGRLRGTKAAILIAGCGTGKEPIELATVFPDAQILAFDLSRASIAYGAQKAKALGLKNIKFKQGDILGLEKFDQRFDYVTASGVLHHMHDPAKGWKILVNLLKPGGFMRIALYSRAARRPITAARKVIAEKGYRNDSEGIRSFRRDIDRVMGKADREFITAMRDYYYMSDCRDLLFHVQEHQMDLPQIAGLIKEFGLELVKLYLPDNVIQQYRREFPADPSLKNLNSWAKFEDKHPETFREMYKFWCRKI